MSLVSLPPWLCEKSLQKVIESKLNRNCQVLSVNRSKGSTAGDHYLSEIVRLEVKIVEKGKNKSISLIVKDTSGGWSDLVEEVNAAKKEIEVYSELIPFANRVLPEPVAADKYYVSPTGCLLLEDLSFLGYKLADRRKQLDYDHSKVALRSLAQFHAASVKLLEISPHSLQAAVQETTFSDETNTISCNLFHHVVETSIKALANHKEGRQYAESLNLFKNTFWNEVKEIISGECDLKVLNHGDYWVTNTMFKYEGEKAIHCRLVDFQMTRYCTPCYDIHLFISTSVQSDVRDNHIDELLEEYLFTLNTTLKNIGSNRYWSTIKFKKAMEDTKAIGILFGLYLTPVVLLDPKEPIQFDGCTRDDILGGFKKSDPYRNVCNNDIFFNHVLSLLKYYRRKNYL